MGPRLKRDCKAGQIRLSSPPIPACGALFASSPTLPIPGTDGVIRSVALNGA